MESVQGRCHPNSQTRQQKKVINEAILEAFDDGKYDVNLWDEWMDKVSYEITCKWMIKEKKKTKK